MIDSARALKDLATRLSMEGTFSEAVDAWKKVLEVAPDETLALQKIGELLVKQGQHAAAVKVYEDVAQRYAKQGMFFRAAGACRVLLSLEPGHAKTQELIAALYTSGNLPAPVKPLEIDLHIETPPTASGLPSIPLFSTLSLDELRDLLSWAMEVRAFTAGEVIVAEGAPGESMFALIEGAGGVHRGWGTPQSRRVAKLSPGDIFGEAAMVSGAPRLATVVADSDAITLEFPRAAMKQVVGRFPRVGQMLDLFYRQRLLANALRASPILRALPESDKKALRAGFLPTTFSDGVTIIKEGQPTESVHILLRGVGVVRHQSGERYPDLQEGDVFGEVSVLTDSPATATVTAKGTVLTLRLSAAEFKARVLHDPAAMLAVKMVAKSRLNRTAALNEALADAEEIVEGEILEDDTRV